jgi:hypothetical protein
MKVICCYAIGSKIQWEKTLLYRFRSYPDAAMCNYHFFLDNKNYYEIEEEEHEIVRDFYRSAMANCGVDFDKKPLPSLDELIERLTYVNERYMIAKDHRQPPEIIKMMLEECDELTHEIRTRNYILCPADQEYSDKFYRVMQTVNPLVGKLVDEKFGKCYDEDD